MIEKISQYLSSIFKVNIPQNQILQQLYKEYRASIIKSYLNPLTQQYLKSLQISSLLKKSVQLYVGSRVVPKNNVIMKMLLQQATIKAKSLQSEKDEQNIKYYSSYFVKMDAMKQNSPKNYQYASDTLMELAQAGHQLSNYLVGKEFYKFIETGDSDQYAPQQLIQKCKLCFVNSLCSQQFGGLYYIADMVEKDGLSQNGLTEQDLKQMYAYAASLGHPLGFFKLSLIYKKEGNARLYKKYLLEAAENGVLEAKHNLGHEYLSGQFFPKNEVKALAWFTNASAHGFAFSKYNIYKLWLNGSSCGRIKQNKQAALVYLEQISRSGEIDVEIQMKELVEEIEGKKVEQQDIQIK